MRPIAATKGRILILLILIAAATAGFAVLQIRLIWIGGTLDRPTTAGLMACAAAGLAVAVAGLWRGAAGSSAENQVWRLMLLGVLVIAGFEILAQGVDVVAAREGRLDGPGSSVFDVGCLLGCAPFYQGLIRWNRSRTRTSDPGDWLNGLSAVLVLVALGNLMIPGLFDPRTGLPGWQLQASLGAGAAVVILLGTAASVSVIGGLLRDPRIWLVILGLTGLVLVESTALVVGAAAQSLVQAVWLLAATGICVSAWIAPAAGAPRAATNQATIVGALVVLLAGVAILTLNNDLMLNGSPLATEFAAAGVLGVSVRVVRLVQDLAHLAQTRLEASTDELTGVANRRALMAAIDSSLRTAGSTSLMIVDLDRFKAINDRYGHAAGDLLLRHVAEAFSTLIPAGGLLARLGGDEFAVLLPDVPALEAVRVAQALAQAAAPLSDVKGRLLQVGASVGVATIDVPDATGGELLRRADAAMYLAKKSGSGVRIYDGALDAVAQQRVDLIEDLHLALEGPEILVFFQPQVSTTGAVVVGAEALVRWQHPRLGLLSPDQFVDLAEDNGLMPGLTARVMREAATQAARWRAAGHELRVSVNLSASCLGHSSLLPLIDEVLGAGLPAAGLVLEVTETSLMTDPERALLAMTGLAERGVGVSIDDYGTGYSSLTYLNDLPATELKIDRSFTARTVGDARTAAIVAGTVELAHRLGMRLIAEGVEDQATWAAMRELGCDETQGYLHSRPLPADAFLAWLDCPTRLIVSQAQSRIAAAV